MRKFEESVQVNLYVNLNLLEPSRSLEDQQWLPSSVSPSAYAHVATGFWKELWGHADSYGGGIGSLMPPIFGFNVDDDGIATVRIQAASLPCDEHFNEWQSVWVGRTRSELYYALDFTETADTTFRNPNWQWAEHPISYLGVWRPTDLQGLMWLVRDLLDSIPKTKAVDDVFVFGDTRWISYKPKRSQSRARISTSWT